MSSSYTFGNCTDVGRVRQANEDYYGTWETIGGQLFVVCDGMGGHVGGAIASRTAVETIQQYFTGGGNVSNPIIGLQKALEAANSAILAAMEARPELQGMGTTAVLVLIKGAEVYYAHIGDSRIYLYRNGVLKRLTKDHSFVQMLVDTGNITEVEAEKHPRRNEINKALGIHSQIDPTICSAPLRAQPGDAFLLCTDGLTGMVADKDIAGIVSNTAATIHEKAKALIDAANGRGGTDNITAQLIQFDGKPGGDALGMTDVIPKPKGKVKPWMLVAGTILIFLCSIGFIAFKKGWIGNPNKAEADTVTQQTIVEAETVQPQEIERVHPDDSTRDSSRQATPLVPGNNDNHKAVSDMPLRTASDAAAKNQEGPVKGKLHPKIKAKDKTGENNKKIKIDTDNPANKNKTSVEDGQSRAATSPANGKKPVQNEAPVPGGKPAEAGKPDKNSNGKETPHK